MKLTVLCVPPCDQQTKGDYENFLELLKEYCKQFEPGKIFTTVGIYPDGSLKWNGVPAKNLPDHILYNIMNRGGRTLLVNGLVFNAGAFSLEELRNFYEIYSQRCAATRDTQPYC